MLPATECPSGSFAAIAGYRRAKAADALVIVTEWGQLRALDLDRMKDVMGPKPAVADLRNIHPPGDRCGAACL